MAAKVTAKGTRIASRVRRMNEAEMNARSEELVHRRALSEDERTELFAIYDAALGGDKNI